MFENPRSARTESVAKLIKVYQKPCTSGVKKNGILKSIRGPEKTRHI